MKVRIFDEPVPVPEKEIILRLIRQHNPGVNEDEIVVAIVGEDGNTVFAGQLVAFSPNMKLDKRKCINKDLGLPLGGSGRLVEGRN